MISAIFSPSGNKNSLDKKLESAAQANGPFFAPISSQSIGFSLSQQLVRLDLEEVNSSQ